MTFRHVNFVMHWEKEESGGAVAQTPNRQISSVLFPHDHATLKFPNPGNAVLTDVITPIQVNPSRSSPIIHGAVAHQTSSVCRKIKREKPGERYLHFR